MHSNDHKITAKKMTIWERIHLGVRGLEHGPFVGGGVANGDLLDTTKIWITSKPQIPRQSCDDAGQPHLSEPTSQQYKRQKLGSMMTVHTYLKLIS